MLAHISGEQWHSHQVFHSEGPIEPASGGAVRYHHSGIHRLPIVYPHAELIRSLQALGGRVEAKVPRQGFILIEPNSNEAERLKLCWESLDRPDRHFVPHTYVEACKISGMLLKQIFVENGEAIKFHIDSSIANINARAALSARIIVSRRLIINVMARLLTSSSTLGETLAHLLRQHV